MKFLYHDQVVQFTGRWSIESRHGIYSLRVEVYNYILFFIKNKFWVYSDYLEEINECGNSNG